MSRRYSFSDPGNHDSEGGGNTMGRARSPRKEAKRARDFEAKPARQQIKSAEPKRGLWSR
ncbi:hypothetical protein ACODT5_28615 [Streptomyces sp. 5.8]|uniref:hypothetical protein n=1 Tax=Streptomyces sp. 5.8 TaxID=3406571 RepID=UPI003BB63690